MKVRFFTDVTAIIAIISLIMLFFKSVYIISDINAPKQENFESLSQESYTRNVHSLWQLQIPKIGLVAEVAEGTSEQILNDFIGHFENTEKALGNIGLAAHNRGYPVNYFAKLKNLKNGDIINIYDLSGKKVQYSVYSSYETDYNDLSCTEQNNNKREVTLITCNNIKNKRRIIKAHEKE